jgi:hypothetical protein
LQPESAVNVPLRETESSHPEEITEPAVGPSRPATAAARDSHAGIAAARSNAPEISAARSVEASPAASDESIPSQPIDVGPAFRKLFSDAKKQGYRDQTEEVHAALEREPRDDSWSYPLEADIQNSLISDTSVDNFKAEHVECRTSMCEIRLSAVGDQQAQALQKWVAGVNAQPWASRIYPLGQTTSSNNGRTDVLVLFIRAPKPAAGPN